MLKQERRLYWKKQFVKLLAVTMVAGSFTGLVAPKEVQADVPTPGGVTGAKLWLQASDSVVHATYNVTTWTDQTAGVVFTTESSRTGVTWEESRANFNPAVVFNGNGRMIGDDNSNINVKEIFTVARHDEGNLGAIFSIEDQSNPNLQGFFRSNGVQFPNPVGVGPTRTLISPDNKKNDLQRLLSVSTFQGKAWENGVAGEPKAPITDSTAYKLQLGVTNYNSYPLKGIIPELIVFDETRELTPDEHTKINSYLALKYGITLKNESGNSTDYIASDGLTTMWKAGDNAGYGNRITGIGRDVNGALDQKQSKSADVEANVTIALGNSVASSNEKNGNGIANDTSFFTFSDNGKAAAFTLAEDFAAMPLRPDSNESFNRTVKIMDREFKVDKTNWQDQNITLQVDGADPANYQLYLLVSADESFGAEDELLALDDEGKVTLNSSKLPDGGAFTFVKFVDKKPLQDKQTEIANENLTETDYTPESWKALVDQQQAADAVLNNPDATLADVKAALEALTSARAGLVKIGALPAPGNVKLNENKLTWDAVEHAEKYEVTIKLKDGTTRTEQVSAGTSLDLSTLNPLLTPGTYELTVTAKTNDPAYTDSAVSTPVTYIVPADKTALQNKVNEAKGLTSSNYTKESWSNLESALTEAERVLNKPDATEAEVSKALTELQQALDSLTALNGVLDQLNLMDEGGQAIVLSPSFDPNQYSYTATVANDVYSISINPAAPNPNDNEVRVSLNGASVSADKWDNLSLQEGKNIVTVGVYDKGGKLLNEYTIEIVRSSTNKLTSLVPSAGSLSPAFDPDRESYTMSVAKSVYQLQFTPTALELGTKIQIRVNNGEWQEVASGSISDYLALNIGTNTIAVRVTNEDGQFKDYTVTANRSAGSSESSNDGNEGSTGSSGSGGSGGSTTSPTTSEAPKDNLNVTLNGNDKLYATSTVSTTGDRTTTAVKVEQDKLSDAISQGTGQKLAIQSPNEGDIKVDGLTADTLKQLSDKGASLEISNLLAVYPVPAGKMNLSSVAGQLGNAALGDIAVRIDIQRSSQDLIASAKSKAAAADYELLVNPVDLDLTFSHDGQTAKSGELNGYAAKYIALPEGIDPNRITTGVIINPDGSVYHVPTVVTEINNRYFALINDLRSSATYSVIWNPQDFDDVKNHWGKEDVNNIAARLELKGNGDNTFSPNRSVTRSEFAEIVVTGLGLMRQDVPQNMFPDITDSAWFRASVALANEFGIVRGYDDGSFNGNNKITREQGFAMIARAYGLIDPKAALTEEQAAAALASYKDAADVSAWAKADVAQLITAGIIQGNGPEGLSPKAQMTRAEVTALIARLLKTTNLIDK